MDQMQQIEKYTQELVSSITEAMELMNNDPERAIRTLRAIANDVETLTALWMRLWITTRSL